VIAEMSALPPEPSAIASTEEVIVFATVSIPSAQYLRRSTEHQQYSLENQQATIAQHADQHGFSVVQTYTDARTGVVLGRRIWPSSIVAGRYERTGRLQGHFGL
jgi:hypothetical protein